MIEKYFRKTELSLFNGRQKGFTLTELLVVIAIITLLSAVVLNSVAASRMKAADVKVAEDLRQVKIAAEMYYLDNKEYPPTASITNEPKTAHADIQNNMWAKKLSFFVKTVEAQSSVLHPITKLCANFDTMAQRLVEKKYLAQIPRHPYDNDAKGVCYKAVKTEKTFVAYGALTQHVGISYGSKTVANKRAGFVVGDTSSDALNEISLNADSLWEGESPYPMDVDGDFAFGEDSVDTIEGITVGAEIIDNGLGGFISGVQNVFTEQPPYVRYNLSIACSYYGEACVGDISIEPNQIDYEPGTSVVINAIPPTGWMTYWNGCDSMDNNVCFVSMNDNKNIRYEFFDPNPQSQN